MASKKEMMNDKKVCIIENERLIGLDLQTQLEKNGYSVFRPLSLVDTEVIIGQDTPDLIIADSEIQQHDNFQRVKKLFGRQHLPIICIGTVTQEAMKECEGINIIGTFTKPFDSKKIARFVDNYFDSRQQRNDNDRKKYNST